MMIMTCNGMQIIDSIFVQRFVIAVKPDAVLIVASYTSSNDPPPITIGRYKDLKEARCVLGDMFAAIKNGEDCFTMPDSLLFFEERIVKDARVKRRGGS